MKDESTDDLPKPSGDALPPGGQQPRISARLSYLLIGGAALGAIVLMCLTVLLLVLLD